MTRNKIGKQREREARGIIIIIIIIRVRPLPCKQTVIWQAGGQGYSIQANFEPIYREGVRQ